MVLFGRVFLQVILNIISIFRNQLETLCAFHSNRNFNPAPLATRLSRDNSSGAPVKRPMSTAHRQWQATALEELLRQRQGFVEKYLVQNPALKIVFVGEHHGMVYALIQTVLNLLAYSDASRRRTIDPNFRMEDCSDLTILREPEGKLGTGVRIEITVQQTECPQPEGSTREPMK